MPDLAVIAVIAVGFRPYSEKCTLHFLRVGLETTALTALTARPHSGIYAPVIIMRTPHGKGFKRNELAGAMERLFAAGEIRSEDYGRPSDTRRRIVKSKLS